MIFTFTSTVQKCLSKKKKNEKKNPCCKSCFGAILKVHNKVIGKKKSSRDIVDLKIKKEQKTV